MTFAFLGFLSFPGMNEPLARIAKFATLIAVALLTGCDAIRLWSRFA